MSQLIERGGSMGWQAGDSSRPGDEPGRGEGPPGLPAAFTRGGPWDGAPPPALLATALEAAAGPGDLYDGADTDAMVGIARHWAAIESWASASLLGALRTMMRE